jgi:type II secretory pathway pseudopilin PulG
MIRTRITQPTRPAFTLVEMMVAMALCVGIMWILAESFKMGLDFTRHARSTGSMMTQLNGAGAVMSRDLLQDHFWRDDNNPYNGGVRLSDQRPNLLTTSGQGWTPPKGGYFRIVSPQPTTDITSAQEVSGFAISSATNHSLQFTTVLGPNDQNLYSATVNGVPLLSRAAEMSYFLVDSGLTTSPGPLGKRLYNLHRRQRLLALTPDDRQPLQIAINGDPAAEVVAHNGTTVFTLADVMNPALRVGQTPFGLASARYGEDLLLSNVLSFEVLVDWDRNVNNLTGSHLGPRAFGAPDFNTDFPYDYLSLAGHNSAHPNTFDTWHAVSGWNTFTTGPAPAPVPTTNRLPLAVRVKGLQITIRIWDPKTKQARQNTWKFSM